MQIKINELTVSKKCHFCTSEKLYQVASVESAPGFLGCTHQAASNDLFLSFNIHVCPCCGLIQTDAQATESIYEVLHSEALGPTWGMHHDELARFIDEHISSQSSVLEIGSSAQPISRRLSKTPKKVFYIDPIKEPPFQLNQNEQYLSGFFPQVHPDEKVDVIIASHVFEHIPQTDAFIRAIQSSLKRGGLFFISIPQFETWFARSYFNAISAEHVTYAFPYQLQFLAEQHHLSLKLELHREHSLFALFSHGIKEESLIIFDPLKNIALLKKWVEEFNSMTRLKNEIPVNQPIYIAGASHLSQYFLLCNQALSVAGVLDNASRKWGARLYGTKVNAFPFSELMNHSQPTVILTPSPYAPEMRDQIRRLNPQAGIIELGDVL
jgi:2-polyprenyl-3-methyl-5-hydroxy-6-metoxy-1,4-benzoquinol methylase